MIRHVFHLSIPVADLDACQDFYVNQLGAEVGRSTPKWIDMLLWGHQITLQHQPDQVLSIESQGSRHFGVVLPWSEWQDLADRLEGHACVVSDPMIKHAGTEHEQAKLYLADPSNNIIEIKAYRDFQQVLGTRNSAYSTEHA